MKEGRLSLLVLVLLRPELLEQCNLTLILGVLEAVVPPPFPGPPILIPTVNGDLLCPSIDLKWIFSLLLV